MTDTLQAYKLAGVFDDGKGEYHILTQTLGVKESDLSSDPDLRGRIEKLAYARVVGEATRRGYTLSHWSDAEWSEMTVEDADETVTGLVTND